MAFSEKIRGFAAAVSNEAATALSRVVQYTEEKLGTSEKTEWDSHIESLCNKSDKTKLWTERIVSKTESVLQPNPNARIEDYLFEKFDKKKEHMRNLEWLGADMIDAGIEYGAATAYGSALIKVGNTQQKLGVSEREFVTSSYKAFVNPLRKFLDEDVRNVMKERKVLESKRLDLDAAKNRLRKAKTLEAKGNAEFDLKIAQDDFDRQVEITKLLLEGLASTQSNHIRHLNDYVEAQIAYYAKCQQHMCELQRELACVTLSTASGGNPNPYMTNVKNNLISSQSEDEIAAKLPTGKKRARVLYDYTKNDPSELNLVTNEVVIVSQSGELDSDWMMAERGTEKGKVPIAYLEILN